MEPIIVDTVFSGITAIATVALVIVGTWAGKSAVATLRQAKADSEARTRPYVSATAVPGFYGPGSVDLLVKNYGQSSALGIKIRLEQWPEAHPLDNIVPIVRRALSEPFDLPPGAHRRVVWIHSLLDGEESSNSEEPRRMGVQDLVHLAVDYSGASEPHKSYVDRISVDAELVYTSPAPPTGPRPHDNMDADTRKLYLALQRIAANIRMITHDQ